MPAALAFIAPATFGIGGSFALYTAAGALTLAGVGVSIGSALALSAASSQRPASVDPENIQLTLRQSTGDRIKHIGRVQVGGTAVFFRTRAGKFYRVTVHGHGKVDGIEAYILNNEEVSLDATGFVTAEQYSPDGSPLVLIKSRLGLATETAYSEITAVWEEWGADHRLDGLFTTLTVAEASSAEDYRETYPNNEPSLTVRARGAQLRDPRDDSVAWSENAALGIVDLVEDRDVFNLQGFIDDAQVAVAADDCDEAFPLTAGGTEPRYRLAGSYSLTEKPDAVLKRMLGACAGQVQLLPNGKIGLHVGKWRVPTVTLGRDELIEITEWTNGPDKLDRYTELPFVYVDPDLDYRETTGDPWVDTAREAAEGEILVGDEQDYSMCPSHSQGRRAAQWQMELDNPQYIVSATFKPSARRALYDRFLNWDIEELGAHYWRVLNYSLNLKTGAVTLKLATFVPPTWSTDFEGTPVVLPDPDEEGTVPQPQQVKAVGYGVDMSAGIAIAWLPAGSATLTPELQYSRAGRADWDDWPLATASNSARLAPLDVSAHDLRIRFNTFDYNHSEWVLIEGVTASSSTVAPEPPTALDVTDDTGGVASVTLTTSSSPTLWYTQILRDGVVVATDYSDPDTAIDVIDACGAGSFSWTARSVSVAKTASETDAGPILQTITA